MKPLRSVFSRISFADSEPPKKTFRRIIEQLESKAHTQPRMQ
jgi:hypothetical protein